MTVTVVITVFNEQKTIDSLLLSLKNQTLQPNEVIIVDGGSRDKTISKINKFVLNNPNFPLRLIEESGNISHGRNVGISQASNKLIALTDAGCLLKKDWLSLISQPFVNKKVEMVAGFYEMKADSLFQKSIAPFFGVTKRNFDSRCFLPSARSIAFRFEVWERVGGFSETIIRAGEDTLFNYEVVKKNIEIYREPRALVVWEVPNSVLEAAKKFFSYARGDAQTGIWWHPAKKFRTHNLKIMTIYGRYYVFLLLLLASLVHPFSFFVLITTFILYISWSIWKLKGDVDETLALMLVPLIQFLSDICVMSGFAWGMIFDRKASYTRS